MAFAIIQHGGIRKHEKYKAAMDRLHRGDWKGAIQDFENLLQEYPDNEVLKETLEDARFKAGFDSRQRIRPRRWIFRSSRRIGRAIILVGILLLLWQGYLILQKQIAPILAARQEARQLASQREKALATLALRQWDEAETQINAVLPKMPDDPDLLAGLQLIALERKLAEIYNKSVSLQNNGDCEAAVNGFAEIQQLRTDYLDVSLRIAQCAGQKSIAELLTSGAVFMQVKDYAEAGIYYEQAKTLGAKALADGTPIDQVLSTIKFELAKELLDAPPLNSDSQTQALKLLQSSLQLNPGNKDANSEKRTLNQFINGIKAHYERRWADAVEGLRAVYTDRPLYLQGQGVPQLYESRIAYGDSLRGGEDCALAYEQYKAAAALNVADKTAALARIDEVIACITPTATPTETPTLTPTPVPTGTPRPTSTPVPLSFLRNKIVFKSDNPEKPGFYAMNSDGSDRQFLATFDYGIMQDQYDKLQEQYRWSPDGRTRSYVTRENDINQIWIERADGSIRPRAITHLGDIAYDPQWSPDGNTILFVSQANGSDDVWLINADGSDVRPLINNDWEWDKWASWSPDSTQIVFWTNREGTKQIYIMDAKGRGLHNISKVPFDEYDPLWIR